MYRIVGIAAVMIWSMAPWAGAADEAPWVALGERLFDDARFSNPAGDLATSCASCHARQDPMGGRAFTELLALSWHPWRDEDPGRETLRNTTTLLDVAEHPVIHYDGEFATLEAQVEDTYLGRNMGWLPEERSEAFRHVRKVMGQDPAYVSSLDVVLERSLKDLSDDELVAAMGKAVADFMRTLRSDFDSPYDQFVAANSIEVEPASSEKPQDYGRRVLGLLSHLEKTGELQWVPGFHQEELAGYRMFLRSDGRERAGNCVACHVPPLFSDFQFRNAGVTQLEYDRLNGDGAFAKLAIPRYREVERPAKAFFTRPSKKKPGVTDLGHWNFAEPETSPLYRDGESSDTFLDRTVATFKTPTLRHLGSTDPYMHTGEYVTLESALEQKIHAAFLARMGQLCNGDEEMKGIFLVREDIPALFHFLNALNDQADQSKVLTHLPSLDGGGSTGNFSRY